MFMDGDQRQSRFWAWGLLAGGLAVIFAGGARAGLPEGAIDGGGEATPSERDVQSKDDDPSIESGTSGSMSLRQVDELRRHGEYEDALAGYRSLLERNNANTAFPESDRNLAKLGAVRSLMRLGRYEEAGRLLAEVSGQRLEAGLAKASLDRLLGDYESALAQLVELVERFPQEAAPRLRLAELYEYLGKRQEAIETYAWFEPLVVENPELRRDAAWITHVAQGFYRYTILTQSDVAQRTRHVLQDMLQVAYALVDRNHWPARVAAADLLREKYSNDEVDGSVSDYQAALEINENLSEALVGLGKVFLSRWDFESVDKVVDAALSVNPRDPAAIRLKAAKLIIERRYPEAMDTAKAALEINPRDLHALGILAGAAACRYDSATVEETRIRFERIAPRSAIFDQILGDALGGIRQYAASERAYLRAIERDPTDANVRAELGLMYMQWGDEAKARDALQAAWSLDQYNERSKNTLDLLDSLDGFDLHETPHFLIKFDGKQDPGLGEVFGSYLESIYEDLVEDYAFELQDKTIIEIFPTQPAFAVRITGKPWIHTIGACTGRVIAMASPRESGELSGPYNFASVLKHEFTHTVTLAATNNRIPHWFTEGLAVYQEDSQRSFRWMQILAEAIRRDELFTLESIDWGFIRPKKQTDRQMAYAQSEWMCEYIVERFGYDRINEMLELYRSGKTQREVLDAVLNITPETFSNDFATWAREEAGDWCFDLTPPEDVDTLRKLGGEEPDDLAIRGRLSRALFDAGDYEEALKVAEQTLAEDESNQYALRTIVSTLGLYLQRANPVQRAGIQERIEPWLVKLKEVEPGSAPASRYLADMYLGRKEFDAAEKPLRDLQKACPDDPASWRGLAAVYVHREQWDKAYPQLLELARRDENDADVRHQLGLIAWRRGQLPDARYWLRQALYVHPFSEEIQEDWSDLAMQRGDLEEALRGYRLLATLKPEKSVYPEKAAFAAHKAGRSALARQLAEQAVRLDPSSAASSILD